MENLDGRVIYDGNKKNYDKFSLRTGIIMANKSLLTKTFGMASIRTPIKQLWWRGKCTLLSRFLFAYNKNIRIGYQGEESTQQHHNLFFTIAI